MAAAQGQAAAQDAQAAADAARADAVALARRLAAAEELLGEVRNGSTPFVWDLTSSARVALIVQQAGRAARQALAPSHFHLQ